MTNAGQQIPIDLINVNSCVVHFFSDSNSGLKTKQVKLLFEGVQTAFFFVKYCAVHSNAKTRMQRGKKGGGGGFDTFYK